VKFKENKNYLNVHGNFLNMVLEELLKPEIAERKPIDMMLVGVLYTTIAVFLSLWVFKDQSSIISVLLIVMAAVPLIHSAIKSEEKKDLHLRESGILKSNTKLLKELTYFFLGCFISYVVWFIALPPSTVSHLFRAQITTIRAINMPISAGPVGHLTSSATLTSIINNNLKVLFFCILFSFFYGAGAIFILTWNASVISAATGSFIRNNLEAYAAHAGFAKLAGYFHVVSLGLLRYLTHGILEIVAYFIGGIAGGLISIALIRHKVESREFKKILKNSLILLLLSIAIVIGAGFVEVYLTPMIV